MSSHPPPPSQDERPTIPAPPVSSPDLYREWEKRLREGKKENGEES